MICLTVSCNQSGKHSQENESESLKDSNSKNYISHCKPKSTDKDWYSSGKKAPKFKGLEGIAFNITTKSKESQEYFNHFVAAPAPATVNRSALAVPGSGEDTVTVTFTLAGVNTSFSNEFGIFPVADAAGRIGTIKRSVVLLAGCQNDILMAFST